MSSKNEQLSWKHVIDAVTPSREYPDDISRKFSEVEQVAE